MTFSYWPAPTQPYHLRVEKSVKLWRMTDMKKSRFTEEQTIDFLRQAEAGIPIKELCRKGGFSDRSTSGDPNLAAWRYRMPSA